MKKKPICLITTDTQSTHMLSCYSGFSTTTPKLDALADEGIAFTNSFCTTPLCTPARSSWYTGLMPNRNGASCNDTGIRRTVPLLAELLEGVGYQSVHFGKWHLDACGYKGGGSADGGFSKPWYDLKNFYSEVGYEGPNNFGGWNKGLDDIEYCFAHRVADQAISHLENFSYKSGHLFMAIEFDEPHGPYIYPPQFDEHVDLEKVLPTIEELSGAAEKPEIQDRIANKLGELDREMVREKYRRYFNCNRYVDYEIGRVVRAIRDKLPDAVIIFTSDHGDHLGTFGLGPKGPTMYDTTCRVPLIISDPALPQSARKDAAMVSSVDIFATILDYAGISVNEQDFSQQKGYDCRSLKPIIDGEIDSDYNSREEVYMEYHRFGVKFNQVGGNFPIRAIRTKEWKLVINLLDSDEFYNLNDDPGERCNRIQDSACSDIRDSLHDKLLNHMLQTQDLLRGNQWVKRPWRSDWKEIAIPFSALSATGWDGKTKWR